MVFNFPPTVCFLIWYTSEHCLISTVTYGTVDRSVRGRKYFVHDPEVMSSNPGQVRTRNADFSVRFWGDKVSTLTHTYPHKSLRKIKWPSAITRLTAQFKGGLMSGLVIYKHFFNIHLFYIAWRTGRGLYQFLMMVDTCGTRTSVHLHVYHCYDASLQALKGVWSYMTPNVLTETRCH